MASRSPAVDPTHFLVPLVWGLWGVAGYYPHTLEPYMSNDAFEYLLVFRVSQSADTSFISIQSVHRHHC